MRTILFSAHIINSKYKHSVFKRFLSYKRVLRITIEFFVIMQTIHCVRVQLSAVSKGAVSQVEIKLLSLANFRFYSTIYPRLQHS